MPEKIPLILRRHFFRRFFENDALSIDAESETTVVRALCFVAVPALMVAFWLQLAYPGVPPRPLFVVAADRYFFVLYSFVVMGAITTLEWEMLFPDRADFLILLPLPLRSRELFYAKAQALLTLLGLFLIAANLFGLILFPAVSTPRHSSYLRAIGPHLAAVTLAGIFSAFAMLAIEGLAICLLPSAWLRSCAAAIQLGSITALLLLFLLDPLIGSQMQPLLEGRSAVANFLPPVWFLGLYEHLALGPSAPSASAHLAAIGLRATAAFVFIAVTTYPLAWSRQKKRALEGAATSAGNRRNRLAPLLHRILLRTPQSRAVFHFLSQTIARGTQYQLYLILYAGAGLALAIASILSIRSSPGSEPHFSLSTPGLHTLLPLLLFWTAVGLRAAFAFPVDLRARWVFPINLLHTGSYPGPAAKAAHTWTLLACAVVTTAILAFLLALHWSYWSLFVQAVCGAAFSALFTRLLFLGRTQIPFTRPRVASHSGLTIILVLYGALFPALLYLTILTEQAAESRPIDLLWIALTALALYLFLHWIDHLARKGIIGGFPEDECDPGPQTLGLSQ